jgi:hypothetical protein
MLYPAELQALNGRGRGIRTPDILLPKQARYQTALYPDDLRLNGLLRSQPPLKS